MADEAREYKLLLENILDVVVILGRDGIVRYVSPSARRLLGREPSEREGRSAFDYIHPDDIPAVKEVFRQALTTQGPIEPVTFRMRHKDGRYVYLEAVGNNRLEDPEVQGAIVVLRDVTTQETALRQLAESEERFRKVAETVSAAIMIHQDGQFRYVNRHTELLTGYTQDELLKMKFWELVHPDHMEMLKERGTARQKGDAVVNRYEFKYLTKRGETRWLDLSGEQMEYGGKPAALAIGFDVTDRKKTEEALLESELKFRTLFDKALDGILIADHETRRFVMGNGAICKMLGCTIEDLLALSVGDIHPQSALQHVVNQFERQMRGEIAMAEEIPVLRKDGSIFFADINSSAILFGGRPCLMGVFRDITDRKLAAEESRRVAIQLQQAQKMESLGVMAGGIAHDFNNLLVSVLGNADIALRDASLPATARHRLEEIRTAAVSASEMTRQMLVCAGRGQLAVKPIDLGELVEGVSGVMEASISKKAALRFNFPEGLPAVEGDAAQLRQVVMNLVRNASEAIGDKSGIISISASLVSAGPGFFSDAILGEALGAGEYVCLSVSDTGSGMEPAVLPKIFEPFFTTRFAGRGLGLAVVLGIVKSHQGAIRVFSEPGRGSRFDLYFPASLRGAVREEEAEEPGQAGKASWTLLCVEDEAAVREVEVTMLEGLGFNVIAASTGQEALALFGERKSEIGAVLLDFNMPEMNGEDVFRELRRLGESVPIILVSGYSEAEVKQRFKEGELAGFLKKPFRRAELVTAVMKILGKK